MKLTVHKNRLLAAVLAAALMLTLLPATAKAVTAAGTASGTQGYNYISVNLSSGEFSDKSTVEDAGNWTLNVTGGTLGIESVRMDSTKSILITLSGPIAAGYTLTVNADRAVFTAETDPFAAPLSVSIFVPTPAVGTATAAAGAKVIAVALSSGSFGPAVPVQDKTNWTLAGTSAAGNPIAAVTRVDATHATLTLTNNIALGDVYTLTASQNVFVNIAVAPFTNPLSVTVSAPEDNPCAIGSTEYPTLSAAVTAASSGNTIRFLRNYDYSGNIFIDKNLTFDLDGYKVNITATGVALTVNGAVFTIDDTDSNSELNVEGAVCGILVDGSSASATVTSATATGTIEPIAALAKNGGTITVTGNATATNTGGIGAVAESGGTITIGGSVLGRARGVAAHGTGSQITVNGTSVTADAVCVLADTGATVTVNANVSSSTNDVYLVVAQNGGTVDVTGNLLADGTGNLGVLAEGDSEVTVNGDISVTRWGVRSHSESHVTVTGNMTVSGAEAMGADADGGGVLNITGDMTVIGANAIGIYATIYNAKPANVSLGGKLTVSGADARAILCRGSDVVTNGDLAVTGEDSIGIQAQLDGWVSVGGSVTASSGGAGSSTGVDCNSSEVEIVGSLTAPSTSYIMLAGINQPPAAGTPDPTHAGYLLYGSGTSKVWVGSQTTYPQVTTGAVSGITVSGAQLSGSVAYTGSGSITERGFVYATHTAPVTGYDTKLQAGSGTGNFNAAASGLSAGTVYYVRAYAILSGEDVYYGNEVQFTTPTSGQATAPTVVTNAVSGVTASGAALSGNIISDGGASVTERGFVYGVSANPTTSGGTKVLAGNGAGGFTATLSGLAANTAYHVRAYAINSQGTSYGENRSFTTLAGGSSPGPGPVGADLPTVLTVSVSGVAGNRALFSGNVLSGGSAAVTERGFVYSKGSNPMLSSGTRVVSGSGTGNFSANVSGLAVNTTYYMRAYAINREGTVYGEVISFTTLRFANMDIPKTGDNSSPWLGVLMLSAGWMLAGVVMGRRNAYHKFR